MSAFGVELRRLRHERGLSLTDLCQHTHYSKGQLSKVENGKKQPSEYLARMCDSLLEANGALLALVHSALKAPATIDPPEEKDDVWIVGLGPGGGSVFHPMNRRDVLTFSAATIAGMAVGAPTRPAAGVGDSISYFATTFDATRRLGQTSTPAMVLPIVVAHAHGLRGLVPHATKAERTRIAVLTARHAEYAGWMAQEAGDLNAARWWTAKSVAIAAEVGEHDLNAYSLVRQALITMYQGDAASTIELARRAQMMDGTPHRVLGLAAQREAQGHALAADYDSCMRALDRAREHLGKAAERPVDGPVLGTSTIADPVGVVTGWCLYDLGRPGEAADVLDREVALIPSTATRAWARFGTRQALAHAGAGDLERTCDLAARLLEVTPMIASDTIRSELCTLSAVLRRWPDKPEVRELNNAFVQVLRRRDG
ncbi:helix-turn-helix domain-containing protein [Lentzea albida]|uniref:Helix-turn-helix domain-containing protein n=1 Tax=Lentzea albida TaxID=65499 RepID=A0A1H9UVC2_9PSEU|nr:helix-turn-helix transcriptional regulator [Lentzea albida]SES13372.1 Helix-turn-helix domain-containing protein [Lentzea albida]